MKYELNKPTTDSDTMSLKAVDEPSTMRARRQAMVVVTETARTGTADLELTRWMRSQPGTALSREKAHSWREAEATMPTVAQRDKVMMREVISAAPATSERLDKRSR